MDKNNNDADVILENKWRQGSVLPMNLLESLVTDKTIEQIVPGHIYLIASHDCDIVHHNFQTEPDVEVVYGALNAPHDGNLSWGKNSRKLQLEVMKGEEVKLLHLRTRDRFRFERHKLKNFEPDTEIYLNDNNIEILSFWLGKRYDRSSFPTVFNDRTKQALKKIEKELKKQSNLVRGVYVWLNTLEELPQDEEYMIAILLLSSSVLDPGSEPEKQLGELMKVITAEFNKCAGIKFLPDQSKVLGPNQMTVEILDSVEALDFDDVSIRNKEPLPH